MVTQQHIQNAVQTLGLSGLPVCLHSSLRSFGRVEGGAEAVVKGLLTEGCTVLVPTFSDGFRIPPPFDMRPERNGADYEAWSGGTEGIGRIYSPDTNEISLRAMGVIPATVLAQPHRLRGQHPLCSFAAIGAQAETLISCQSPKEGHPPFAFTR